MFGAIEPVGGDRAESPDESLGGNRLAVFGLGVAGVAQAAIAWLDLDVGWQTAASGGDGKDDSQGGTAMVELVSGDNHGGPR